MYMYIYSMDVRVDVYAYASVVCVRPRMYMLFSSS